MIDKRSRVNLTILPHNSIPNYTFKTKMKNTS